MTHLNVYILGTDYTSSKSGLLHFSVHVADEQHAKTLLRLHKRVQRREHLHLQFPIAIPECECHEIRNVLVAHEGSS